MDGGEGGRWLLGHRGLKRLMLMWVAVNRKTTQEPGQDRAWYCEGEGCGKEEEVKGWNGVVAALRVEMDKRQGGMARHVSTSSKTRCVCMKWRLCITENFKSAHLCWLLGFLRDLLLRCMLWCNRWS